MLTLTSIHTYPIKSCAGLSHATIELDHRGLRGDRRWLLVDENHRFITAREQPTLVRVQAQEAVGALVLNAPGRPELEVAVPARDAARVDVQIWKDHAPARRGSADADAWFSDYLNKPCRLVYQHDDDHRPIIVKRGDPPGATGNNHVSFADAYPLLLIGSASLDELNRRLEVPVSMRRFRTNLVVATDEPFVEDRWTSIAMGDCVFDVAKRCARCVLTTVDPDTGGKDPSGEPLTTLRGFRLSRAERGVLFGVNLLPRSIGQLIAGQGLGVGP